MAAIAQQWLWLVSLGLGTPGLGGYWRRLLECVQVRGIYIIIIMHKVYLHVRGRQFIQGYNYAHTDRCMCMVTV